jgi:hypothetical protein
LLSVWNQTEGGRRRPRVDWEGVVCTGPSGPSLVVRWA